MPAKNNKPLGQRSYGSIPHLPGSRLGPGDHTIHEGQANILTVKTRDRHDRVLVTEKLDGSNVSVANIDGKIVPLMRAGYRAIDSNFSMHHEFHTWAMSREEMFKIMLQPGERACGEWLAIAHGTRYALPHEPFVMFDIMRKPHQRAYWDDVINRGHLYGIKTPKLLSDGPAFSIEAALEKLGDRGFHGALEEVEGAVWRLERKDEVQFLAKYVRHSKVDGKYLQNGETIRNEMTQEAIHHGHPRLSMEGYVGDKV